MRRLLPISIFASALAAFIVAMPAKTYQFPPLPKDILYGTPPGKDIHNWIRLNMLGPRSSIPPILWISSQKFPRKVPDVLIVFPMKEYLILAAYAQANQCPIMEDKAQLDNTLQTTEYSHRHIRTLCIMRREATCRYLSGMVTLPNIEWTDDKLGPIRELSGSFKCEKR